MLRDFFLQCDQLLAANVRYWQRQPFHFNRLQDCHDLPDDLTDALAALSADDFYTLTSDTAATQMFLSRWLPDLDLIQPLEAFPSQVDSSPVEAVDKLLQETLSNGMPGRKWQQILTFSAQLPKAEPHQHLLEWCAGKGHLGRFLSIQKQYQVTSLEWQPSLCDQGEALIHRQKKYFPKLRQSMLQGDALSNKSRELIADMDSVVALHACGDLHTTLIQHACCPESVGRKQLAIAPCCYHLTQVENYQAFSKTGQMSSLRLSRQDLKIPLQETVTGGQRVERLRDQELLWRLSFDSLRQAMTGEEHYQPLPAFNKKRLSGEFTDFVRWALTDRQLCSDESLLPGGEHHHLLAADFLEHQLTKGAERLLVVRKLEWLQSPFRRLLELWLVTDRALALEEAGFHVKLLQFCDKTITPRNLLILAKR